MPIQNDIGVPIILTFHKYSDGSILDISTATNLKLYIKKPSRLVSTKIPVFLTDGTDGKIVYTTIVDDLDELGYYKLQGKATLDGAPRYSTIKFLLVTEALPIEPAVDTSTKSWFW